MRPFVPVMLALLVLPALGSAKENENSEAVIPADPPTQAGFFDEAHRLRNYKTKQSKVRIMKR